MSLVTVLDKISTLRNATLAAIAEAWIVARLQPQWLPESIKGHNFLPTLVISLILNYTFLAIYVGIISSYWLSPLAKFPAAKVGPNGRVSVRGRYSSQANLGKAYLEWATNTPDSDVTLLRRSVFGNALLVHGPKALQEVLVTKAYDFEKPPQIRGFLRQVLGNGLIVAEGDQHKFQRKHVMPAFNFRHIKDLYPLMWEKAVAVTKTIEAEVRDSPTPTYQENGYIGTIEIGSWANKAALDIIGIAGLGREFNSINNADDPLIKEYHDLTIPNKERFLYFLARTQGPKGLVERLPWKMNTLYREKGASLRQYCRSFVSDKRAAIKTGGDEHFDLLSLLLKSGDFSDEDLCDQLLTFLAAGHETTASAFTWSTYLLSINQQIQSRLRSEVLDALASPSSTDLASTFESLPLLNAVINETLRLYPTVPVTIRRCLRPTILLGKPIPQGTDFVVSAWATNRLPSLWGDDAEEFRPDRWITEGKAQYTGGAPSNYAFTTFLHGPRACIGQGFARAELRCLLASFVKGFEWDLDMKREDVVVGGVVTVKPRDGLRVRLKVVE